MWQLLSRLLLAAHLRLRPPAPGRFGDLIRLFRSAFPEADADRWEAFCEELAAGAYWEGERRGYDRARGIDEAALRDRHDWTAPRRDGLPATAAPDPGGTAEEVERVRELLEAARAAGVPVEVRAAEGTSDPWDTKSRS